MLFAGLILGSCDGFPNKPQNIQVTGNLAERSTDTLAVDLPLMLWDFRYSESSAGQTELFAYSPLDSTIVCIRASNQAIEVDTVCKLKNYERYFSIWLEDCSLLTLSNETGEFTLKKEGLKNQTWKFDDYAPQVIPDRLIQVMQGGVYVPNSSYHHDVSTLSGAQAYYRETAPILRFDSRNPEANAVSMGRFPFEYMNLKGYIGDFQPYFCVNDKGQTVISFSHSDSLIIADHGVSKAVSCKSASYKTPVFLSYEEAENLSMIRKFMAETPRYTHVLFNPHKKEYYRFLAHDNTGEEVQHFSIIVLNEAFERISEWEVNGKSHAFHPLLFTDDGFMLLNIEMTRRLKQPYFEHFEML